MSLRPAAELRDRALEVLATTREELTTLGVDGDLVLVGGTSVAGALTVGDVDLHLRVPPEAFDPTVALLSEHLAVASPAAWAPTLAVFAVPAALPTGLAVTPVGSEHDVRFTRCWQRLAAEPALLAEYNAVKAEHVGTSEYEAEKSAFFDRLL